MGKKAKAKAWKFTIHVQPMGWAVYVVTQSNLADFCQWAVDHGENLEWASQWSSEMNSLLSRGGASFYWDSGHNYLLVLPAKFRWDLTYHEALHCAIRLWHNAGARLKLPLNEEVLTYTTDHIVREVKKLYKEMKHGNA